MAGATYLCGGTSGGPCPRCGFDTEKGYDRARVCMEQDGGCGWSDYEPEFCAIPPEGWWCSRDPNHDGPCAAREKQRWRDSQGDTWFVGSDGLMHSYETAPFPREHVEKKWGPLMPVHTDGSTT
ncbi:hypothetical protein [Microbacterium lacus]|uniref:hypothetical protein n=1 Tax=Microbacterium lacus TaxID=415217 RepID=UPI0012FD9F56|nr:hypothetical protein [Microbacterium lacus]